MSQANVMEAVKSGNMDALRELLARDRALASSRDSSGVSALMHAVYRGRTDIVNLLRESGVTLDIFEAAAIGDVPRLATLVQQNPSLVNTYSADGFSPLHFAAYFSQPAAARFLLDHGAKPAAVAKNPTQVTPLHSAAAGRNLATVRDLLEHGGPVNARQQHGWTALHSAAQNGSDEMVSALLQHGADRTMKNDDGVTASDLALKAGHPDLAKRLA